MILLDFSQVMWISIHANFGKDSTLTESDAARSILRNMLLQNILFFKQKFHDYGQVVVCCDGNQYWRKDYLPSYKGNRVAKRENLKIDYKFVSGFEESFKQELRDYFPYPVIEIEKAEADDVIGVLCKWSQSNNLVESMFDSSPEPTVIISEDQDFLQLQKYKNIKQYAPRKKVLIKPDKPLSHYLIEHIVRGDDVDFVGNILSPENSLMDKIRQKPVTKPILDEFYQLGIDACKNDEQRRLYKRNQILVDLDYIPEDISDKIIQAYIDCKPVHSKAKMMNYLVKYRCGKLIGSLGGF